MSTFIDREIAKTLISNEEIYVCMYVHNEVLINLAFFKKTEKGFEELLRHHVSEELSKELVRRVRANEVEKVTPLEAKVFNQSLDKHNFFIAREIKEIVNKTNKDMKAEHIGEIAGMSYLVSTNNKVPAKQIYLLQKSAEEIGFEIGRIPAPFVEMTILDYVHRFKVKEKPIYLMVNDNQFIGLKRSKNDVGIIYVVSIEVFPESVSASKAYMISKDSRDRYTLLPIQKSTPSLMEGLQKEGKFIMNEFIKEMNIITK